MNAPLVQPSTAATATDTGDKLRRSINANRLEDLDISPERRTMIRSAIVYEHRPFVKDVIFLNPPDHDGCQPGNFIIEPSSTATAHP